MQPSVLPASFPNLFVNGSTGIAVGMATNMAPHNLGEVVDAVIFAIDNPDAPPEAYLDFVKAPDFPTGGYIVGTAGIRDAMLTGRGSIKIRAVSDVEEVARGERPLSSPSSRTSRRPIVSSRRSPTSSTTNDRGDHRHP